MKKKNSENRKKHKLLPELMILAVSAVGVFIVAAYYDILENLVEFSRQHERWELDEIISLSIYLVAALAFFSLRRWLELRKALAEIKQLEGILPICAECKEI